MFKYTKYLLQKIEDLFGELAYEIKYARGSFQSGYCIVQDRNYVVINKFFDTEARINCLLEILEKIEPDPELLSEQSLKLYKKLEKEILQPANSTQ